MFRGGLVSEVRALPFAPRSPFRGGLACLCVNRALSQPLDVMRHACSIRSLAVHVVLLHLRCCRFLKREKLLHHHIVHGAIEERTRVGLVELLVSLILLELASLPLLLVYLYTAVARSTSSAYNSSACSRISLG